MKHAREDYNRIQDPAGLIPEDEPVFLLRGQDVCSIAALEYYHGALLDHGAAEDIIAAVDNWIGVMKAWQKENTSKVPDLPSTEL